MSDQARIKRNIAKMIAAGAPESEIDQYVASEKVTPAQLRGEATKPKPVATAKPRPPLSAYVDTPAGPRAPAPRPRPTGKLPVQSELLAPMRAMGATTAPQPRAPRVTPQPVAMQPGVASIFGGEVTPYATPEFDPLTVKRADNAALTNDGLLDRTGLMAKRSAMRIGSGGARVLAAGMNAISEGFGDPLTARADDVDQYIGRPIAGETTLDDLGSNFSLGKLGSFIAEQSAGSAADMGMLMTGAGVVPYMTSQAGNIGQQRAENNSTGTATLSDIIKAAPAAAVSTAAERLGTKYLGGEMGGNLLTRLGGSVVSEAATEGVQSLAEYTGGTAGTDRGFDLNEALSQSARGAITGGLVAPGLRVATAELPNAAGAGVAKLRDVLAERADQQAFSPLANAIAVDAFRPRAEATPPAITEAPYRVEPAGRTVTTTDKDGTRAFVAKVGETAAPAAITTPEAPKVAPKPVAPVAAPAAVEQPPIEQPAPAGVTKAVTPAPVEQPDDVSLTPDGDQNYRQLWQMSRADLENLRKTAPRDDEVDEGVTSVEVIDEMLREHQDYTAMDDDTLVGIVRRQIINNRDADWVKRVKEGRGEPGQQASFVSFIGAMGELRTRPDGANLVDRITDQLVDQGWSKADAQEVVEYRFSNLTGKKPGEARAKPAATPQAAPALSAPTVTAKAPIAAREETRRVTIPTGGKIDVRMELVNADDITQAEGSKQNRDRDRAASEAQIMSIVGKFDPEQLGDDNYTDRGAPIIGPDGTIESGNGRVLAINRVFAERPDAAKAYRDYIESQGFDTKGIERPILIRRRVTEMDDATLRSFITGSNSDTKQELSAPERATQDASDILTPDVFTSYMGGALTSQRNGDFIRKFIDAVPDGQRSTFMDDKGNLSTAGVARIENAMLARAFGNGSPAAKRFLSKAMENTDNQTRTLTGALSEVAADWGKMTEAMQDGTVDKQYDLTDKVLEAIGLIADTKGDGQSVANILKSEDMYDKMDPVVRRLIEAFHGPNGTRMKSKQKIAEMLENYARLAMEQRPTPDMFGDVVLRDPIDVLNEAFGDAEGVDMFAVAAEDALPRTPALADAAGGGGRKSSLPRRADVDLDALDAELDDDGDAPAYASDMPLEDAGPYDPSIMAVSFTNRASIYTAVANEMGVDPAKFRLLPSERQIFLLSKLIYQRFGIQVITDRQLQDRFAIDQMLDMIQNVQGMAHVLGLGGSAISLGGKLRLSLAKKARYLGAYYPGETRIDLPQRSNSFSHEWGHAFDYHMMALFPGAMDSGLSGALRNDGRNVAASGGPEAVRAAFVNLMNTMFFDHAAMAKQIMDAEAKLAATQSATERAKLQGQIDSYRAGSSKSRKNLSEYYTRAKAIQGDYWQKPTEMFARAFEAYVSFRVEALGLTTEFIGKGDAAYLSDADDRLAQTFPKGKERNDIFRAFDELFARVNEAEALGREPVMPEPDTGDTDPVSNLDKLAKAAPKTVFAREMEAWKAAGLLRSKAKTGRADSPKGRLKRLEDALSALSYSMAGRVRMISRHWKSPAVMSLHNMLTHLEGKGQFVGETFLEAVSARRSRNLNRLSNILRKHDLPTVMTPEQDQMLRDLLITQDVSDAPANFVAAASAIRQLLDQEFYENQNVGLDIGYVKNGYLPRIIDMPKIDFDSAGFLAKAGEVYEIVFDREFGTEADALLADEEKFVAFWKTVKSLSKEQPINGAKPFRKAWNELNALYRAMAKSDEPDSFSEAIGKKAEEVTELLGELMAETRPIYGTVKAERWLSAMRTSDMDDFDAHSPNADYAKNRELPPEADKLLEDFYVNNPVEAIVTYLSQSAKRTEYARTFGPKGEKRKAIFQKIAGDGVSIEDQQALQRIVDIATGRERSTIPKSVQGALSFIHAAGTMVLLPRAVLSSLSESVTAGMRTQDVRNSFRALAQLIGGALGTASGRERAELARAIGIVDDMLVGELAEARFGGTFGDVTRWDKYVATMFERTGLIALTRSQRTHLLGTAQAYFDNLAGNALSTDTKKAAQASALLRELGVRDVEAFSKQIREMGRLPTVEELDTPYGRDFAVASSRLIDQIIQNPTVMDRPQLANNPVGRVAYGIMSFSYAFYRNIVKRQAILFNETRKRTGAMDATARLAIGFLPSAIALYIGQTLVSTIREFLLNRERWDEEEEKGTLVDTMLKLGATRTFSFAGFDPLIQAHTGLKYQRDLSNVMVGAAPGFFLQAIQSIAKMNVANSPKTNTAEFNAAKGVYQLAVAPALAFGLARLPGGPIVGPVLGGGIMAGTSPQAGKEAAELVVGEKGSVTDPVTGEITGPPKKKGAAKDKEAANKYAF